MKSTHYLLAGLACGVAAALALRGLFHLDALVSAPLKQSLFLPQLLFAPMAHDPLLADWNLRGFVPALFVLHAILIRLAVLLFPSVALGYATLMVLTLAVTFASVVVDWRRRSGTPAKRLLARPLWWGCLGAVYLTGGLFYAGLALSLVLQRADVGLAFALVLPVAPVLFGLAFLAAIGWVVWRWQPPTAAT